MKKRENSLTLFSRTKPFSIKVKRVDFNKKWEEVNSWDNLADIPEFKKEGNEYIIEGSVFVR